MVQRSECLPPVTKKLGYNFQTIHSKEFVSLLSTANQYHNNLLSIFDIRDQKQTDQLQARIHGQFW